MEKLAANEGAYTKYCTIRRMIKRQNQSPKVPFVQLYTHLAHPHSMSLWNLEDVVHRSAQAGMHTDIHKPGRPAGRYSHRPSAHRYA